MKILFIAPLPPPITGHSLAAKVILDELIMDHTVEVINLSKYGFAEGILTTERIVEVIKILRDVWRRKDAAEAIYLTISESLAGNVKDLVIYLMCFKSLSRMYIHLHGGSIKKNLFDKNRFLFNVNRYFIRRLAGSIVLGPSHVSIFSNMIHDSKIYTVPNFSEDQFFLSEEEVIVKFESTNPLRILFLSNLIEGKGFNELYDAYISLSDDLRERVRIDFAGEFESDAQKKTFLGKIEAVRHIYYHGVVKGSEKKHLLGRAHIFCLPTSYSEGQPISILEAYASGCVVLTTNCGGIPDIFADGINGFEIQSKSASSIKRVLERIAGNMKMLLPIGISNRNIANDKYRASIYISSLKTIIEAR